MATPARAALLLLLALAAPAPAQPAPAGDELRVMAWNVALIPWPFASDGQRARAAVIPLLARGHDVVVLSEAFDDDLRDGLARGLRSEYPHRTRVVGKDGLLGLLHQDGGVVLLSRWPIVREAQVVYRDRAGVDALARKGAIYACVQKGARRWHVFGTHLQSADRADVRTRQLEALRRFVDAQAIPADEPVLFAGDLNVDLAGPELPRALSTLDAVLPPITGLGATWDPPANRLASGRREFLDYVLWSRRHARPAAAVLEARRVRAPFPLWLGGRWGREASDHEPVIATVTLPPAARGLTGVLGTP
jgi:endonuclease/exonuclease/phosphatase family metal-dependent hydrolase